MSEGGMLTAPAFSRENAAHRHHNYLAAAFAQGDSARAGAFPLASGTKDAALLFTTSTNLNYTLLVSGANGETGVALVEIYDVTGL